MKPTIFVMLGRAGDVINLFPVLQRFKERTGEQPLLLVGKDFAPILDGVSYISPIVWNGAWQNCLGAIEWAKQMFGAAKPTIINAAVYGTGYYPTNRTASFDRESWDRSDCDVPWGHKPLVFDRRNKRRETDLVKRLCGQDDRPKILLALSSHSSPLASPADLTRQIMEAFPSEAIVDISFQRAERIFDLLALYEQASCLVAADSAPMHLAAAMPNLPVVMLTDDRKNSWLRSSWRPQHASRLFYSDVANDPGIVIQAIQDAMAKKEAATLWHVYAQNPTTDRETVRRMGVARQSWDREIAWTKRWKEIAVPEAEFPRDARSLRDPSRLPFMRDLLKIASARCSRPNDAIVFSNADVGVAPGITGWIIESFLKSGAIFTHRWDFEHKVDVPPVSEAKICEGRWYCGSDLFAFTKSWWDKHGNELPDVILGREAVDLCLRHLIKRHGGIEIPGCVWHEKHASMWEHFGNRHRLMGNQHNRHLATLFLNNGGGSWLDGVERRPGLRRNAQSAPKPPARKDFQRVG